MLNFLLASIQHDPMAIMQTGGYLGIALIVFAESGLLIGMFLPGDSLLFTAGLLAESGLFSIGPLIVIVVVSAILGDSVGYWFGKKVGGHLQDRKDSWYFKQEYLRRTERFYQKHGGRALILARFVPIVRTLAPILAGAGSMTYRKFLAYNIIGGILWGAGMTLLGFLFGSVIPDSEKYIVPISLAIIVVSLLPILVNLARSKRGV